MNHIGQHIILALDVYCVIFKGCRVHPDFCTGDHLNDSIFQSIVIHVDQRHNCIVRSSFRPISFEFPSEHHTDNCLWVIDLIFIQQISVIPTLYFIAILMIFFCQFLHFLLSKTDIRCKVASTQHGKLIKIVQCWLRFFLFYWKNARKICQLNILCGFCSLEHPSQKVYILILCFVIGCLITNEYIPFINDDDKLLSRLIFDSWKCIR